MKMLLLTVLVVVLSGCSQGPRDVETVDPTLAEVDRVIMAYRDSLMLLQQGQRSSELMNDARLFVREFSTLELDTSKAKLMHQQYVRDCSMVLTGRIFICAMQADQIVGTYISEKEID